MISNFHQHTLQPAHSSTGVQSRKDVIPIIFSANERTEEPQEKRRVVLAAARDTLNEKNRSCYDEMLPSKCRFRVIQANCSGKRG